MSGPTTANILSATAANSPLSADLVQQGTYVFQLTVTDNGGATATSQVTITVNPAVSNSASGTGLLGNYYNAMDLSGSVGA